METPKIGNAETIEVGGDDYNQYVNSIYKLLPTLMVELDPDPLEFGPSRISGKIALCRKYTDKVEMIFKQLSEIKHYTQRKLRIAQAEYELAMMELIANDPAIRSGRSQREREALANLQLLDELKEVRTSEGALEDIQSVIVVLKATRADLRDTRARIKDQASLVEADRSLGRAWGYKDENGKSQEKEIGDEVDRATRNISGDRELDDLLSDASPPLAFALDDETEESAEETQTEESAEETQIEESDTVDEDILPGDDEGVEDFLSSPSEVDDTPSYVNADADALDDILSAFE